MYKTQSQFPSNHYKQEVILKNVKFNKLKKQPRQNIKTKREKITKIAKFSKSNWKSLGNIDTDIEHGHGHEIDQEHDMHIRNFCKSRTQIYWGRH